jgi:Domain of unknown function (DUF4386)
MGSSGQAVPPAGSTAVAAGGHLEGAGSRNSELRHDLIPAIRTASTTAGIALVLLVLLAAFGDLVVMGRLVVEGDAVRTAANFADSETLFRLGIASLLVVAGLDIVVAWALFTVFEPVSSRLSMLAAWFRVVYAAIFAVAIAQLVGMLRLLPEAHGMAAQVLSGVHAYEDIWTAGLVLFGFHLILLGVLALRASYAPVLLGILLVVAGLGYVVDGFGVMLFAGYGANVAAFTFVGEVVLIVWLLVSGRRITVR